ncbi:BTB/POZ domain-containing protein 2-like [Saccostrea cucullata]|uniref:BTB/POZ domain-containing protein 2-like n=1 Tax=Saccostrea cuccullata TaxID=36930 RepID=UPI002ED11E14
MDQEDMNWQAGRKVLECNKYMLTNQIQFDVTFKVGQEEKEVKAHRYVLGSRSSVFYAMMFGSLSGTSFNIAVPDIEHEVFQNLLRFLYYEETNINEESVTGTLYASEKYGVTDLKEACNSYLKNHINEESVCAIMENAKLFNLNDLLTRCIDFIVQSEATAKTFLKSHGFLSLSRECLMSLLKLDTLPVNEEFLYKSLRLWSHKNCEKDGKDVNNSENIRSMMGDLLYQIGFPLMSLETFWKEVAWDNILTTQEKDQISKFIVGIHAGDVMPFLTNPRKKVISIYRGTPHKVSCNLNGDIDALKFKVNKSLHIRGLILLGSLDYNPSTYTIEAKIINSDNETVAFFSEQSVTNTEREFQIIFDNQCSVKTNQEYTIWLKMVGPPSFQVMSCHHSVTENGVNVIFSESEWCTNGTTVSYGQIPGLLCLIPL